MADINIEKKDSSPIWPWILGILALLIILALIFWPSDDDAEIYDQIDRDTTEQIDHTDAAATTTAGAATVSSQVQEYVSWIEQNSGEMGLDHEFTHNGLDKMTAALSSIAQQTKDVEREDFQGKFDKMTTKADEITEEPMSTEHADKIKKAFQAQMDVLNDLQDSSFPDMDQDVERVKKQVEDLDPKTLTLEQKGQVRDVFRSTAQVLEKMDRSIDS